MGSCNQDEREPGRPLESEPAKRAEPSVDTSALEGEIDRLVAARGLYELTEEEIAFVEKSVKDKSVIREGD